MKISFDYDGVFSESEFQKEARVLKAAGHEICIVTKRAKLEAEAEDPVLNAARSAGISEVHFTSGADKYPVLEAIGADAHYDDSDAELKLINANCKKTIGVKAQRMKKTDASRRMKEKY